MLVVLSVGLLSCGGATDSMTTATTTPSAPSVTLVNATSSQQVKCFVLRAFGYLSRVSSIPAHAGTTLDPAVVAAKLPGLRDDLSEAIPDLGDTLHNLTDAALTPAGQTPRDVSADRDDLATYMAQNCKRAAKRRPLRQPGHAPGTTTGTTPPKAS